MRLLHRLRRKRPSPDEVDQISLAHLRALGADLGRPRHVLHFVYFDHEPDARNAAKAIETAGYEATVLEPSEKIAQWCVRAETTRVVNESTLRAVRAWFELLAQEHRGEYDGWEAAAKP